MYRTPDLEQSRRFSELWTSVHRGFAVSTDTSDSQKLFGFRDGFRQYFASVGWEPEVQVRARGSEGDHPAIPTSDERLMTTVGERAARLYRADQGSSTFSVASESGLSFHEAEGSEEEREVDLQASTRTVVLVKTWVAMASSMGTAYGVSGGVQIPHAILQARAGVDIPVPGHRRKGGIVGSLTRGVETRRSAIRQATLYALSTMFYGCFDDRTIRRW